MPTDNRLPVEEIENNFAGSTFDHPLLAFGDTLIHVRRPKDRGGYVVAATDTKQGRPIWETDLAMPPAGAPVVDDATKTLIIGTPMATCSDSMKRPSALACKMKPAPSELMPANHPPLHVRHRSGPGTRRLLRGKLQSPPSVYPNPTNPSQMAPTRGPLSVGGHADRPRLRRSLKTRPSLLP